MTMRLRPASVRVLLYVRRAAGGLLVEGTLTKPGGDGIHAVRG